MSEAPDYYADLGLTPEATPDDIRRAYHKLARELHPDLSSQANATEAFLKVQAAYDVLSDPARRAQYDQSRGLGGSAGTVANLSVLYSRPTLLRINEPQLIIVLMELTAPPEAKTLPSPALNVCLVLDRSTSMQGERLDTVKSTAVELIRHLRPEDIVSIVTFSDRAEVLVSGGRQSEQNALVSKIQMVQAGGGTEIYRGLEAGFFEVRSRFTTNAINHIILLTDGRTYGDEADCLRLADQAAIYGIGISGLGIGQEWNDAFLDGLAMRTGGSSMYLSKPDDIHRFLKEKFLGLGQVYAERVTFDVDVKPGVELRYAFRLSPDAGPLNTTSPVRLGMIPKDSRLAFVLEFLLDPIVTYRGRLPLAEGQIMLDIPTRTNPHCILSLQLSREVSDDPDFPPPPTRLLDALSRLTLYRMQERANRYLTEGHYERARANLHNLATHLYSRGLPELAHMTLQEANNVEQHHALSESGKKAIKYGTRALLLPASLISKSEEKAS